MEVVAAYISLEAHGGLAQVLLQLEEGA